MPGWGSWLRIVMGALMMAVSFSAAALNCATPGKDGPAGVLGGVINSYWPGASNAGAGAASINLGASTTGAGGAIAVGDLLLVIQMQDAAIDSGNGNTYGSGGAGGSGSTNIRKSGQYEFVRATGALSASGGSVSIVGGAGAGLLNAYSNSAATGTRGQRSFQVVRVPQYTTATLGSSLTAAAWNGSSGGVLAFDVAGELKLNGATANVNGLGFRGGAARQLGGGTGANTDYRTDSSNNANGSKGEGIAGTPRYLNNGGTDTAGGSLTDNGIEGYPNGSHARGAPGNAGGGGTDGSPANNAENTGGGGGSNAGVGGKGGNGWNEAFTTGGFGGFGYSASLGPARLFLGGGGGSGTTNDGTGMPGSGFASSGAAGGGLVMVRVGIITGSGTISANGSNANNSVENDGSGGGGAGGSVLVHASTSGGGTLTIQANGGNGGTNTGVGSAHGPGGGGSGGFALVSSNVTASISVSGGAAGTTWGGVNFGATAGTSGTATSVTAAQIPGVRSGAECAIVVTKTFSPDPIIAGGVSTLSITLNSNNDQAISGIVLNDVFPTTPGSMQVASPPTVTSSCGGGLLNSSGGPLAAGDAGVRLNAGALVTNGTCTFSIKVTTAVAGNYTNTIPAGALATTSGQTNGAPASDTLLVNVSSLVFMKTASVTRDPSNLTVNPKSIPGAEVLYTLRISNTGAVAADSNSTVITDPIPANTDLFVGDLGAVNSGPVAFVQGAPTSGLTWTFSSLGSATDDLAFSNTDCTAFTYIPVPVSGYDPAVKCIRLNPKGLLATGSASSNPSFELRFRVRIK